MINYYHILGLSPNCTKTEVKKAYRKLAFQFHPDTSGIKYSDEKIKMINEAYAILKDDYKRRNYDLKMAYMNNLSQNIKTTKAYTKNRNYNTTKPNAQKHSRHYEKRKEFKQLETFMFSVLLFIGIFGFCLACADLYEYGYDGAERLNGFIFSILFTTLLLLVWKVKKVD